MERLDFIDSILGFVNSTLVIGETCTYTALTNLRQLDALIPILVRHCIMTNSTCNLFVLEFQEVISDTWEYISRV